MSSTVDLEDAPVARWELCPRCRAVLHHRRLARSWRTCPDCGAHLPMTAVEWVRTLFDDGSVTVVEHRVPDTDPLEFVDVVPYRERRERARERTGLHEAVVVATGTVTGTPVTCAAMDFRFLGGSLGAAAGELVTVAGERALAASTPLVIVTASGGARMQEGVLSLMQMAKTSQMLHRLDEAGLLTVSVIADPTFGGVAASYATGTDIVIAEPGARLGFAGPRVIEQTIGRALPSGFQTAEFLAGRGLVDLICPRAELRGTLGRLLGLATGTVAPEDGSPAALVTDPGELPDRDPWDAVLRARDIRRPTTADYLATAFDEFVALRGDRLSKDCPALLGGLARLGGTPVVALGTQKGHTAAELAAANFGSASPAGYRKSARLMRLAAKLGLPVVTLIDTPGAHPGLEAEENGQAQAISDNLRLLAKLPVPVVAVVTGEGGSGGALALALADRVLMCADAVYSVISPEGCAAILWRDKAAAPGAAAALGLHAKRLLRLGVVDGVIPEPEGGAHADHRAAADRLRAAVSAALAPLTRLTAAELADRRHARFRRFGAPSHQERTLHNGQPQCGAE
ncbi:carboxyltransferase subunit alpha [Amycolatopsis minnesotensis]|uniref:Multifunctional fusion protein n=1 Tax=Amycolatopsis minnesotensis TaxID=337894 RepID=A0ABN2RLJ7_9PSEU